MTDSELQSGIDAFDINNDILKQWQEIVNSLAKLMNVPAALIMRLNEKKIEILRMSDSKNNPFKLLDNKHFFNSGLYCETVIRADKRLYVPDALKDEDWKDNPDIALNMVSYLGFPIKHADSTPFGTLCILDDHERTWSLEEENVIIQFRNMIENHLKLISTVEQVSILNESLQRMAYYDYMTNIYNRRYFFEVSETTIALCKREKKSICIVIIDIDNFKSINDTYGHDIGDEVIKTLAKETTNCIRESDIFARFGGEEFIILLPNTNENNGVIISEKIRSTVENIVFNDIKFTVSLGVSQMNLEEDSLTDAIKRADNGLYKAKNSGKNKVVIN